MGWVGGLFPQRDKIGYKDKTKQANCFSPPQRDRLSIFLLHLDGRALTLCS